ncbi:MAG: oligosaccharide flippase family protein [Sedimentisphaerales bacterium]
MSTLAKTSIVYGTGAILTKAFGFFLIPLYTRYFTVEEYGILALLNIMLQLVTFVFLLGVSSAAMRFYFDPDADEVFRKQLYGNAMLLLLIFPAVLLLLTGPLAYLLVDRFLPSVPFFPYVFIILILGLFVPMKSLTIGLLRVQKRAIAYVAYTFSFFLVQTIVIIIAVAGLGYGLKGQIYAQLLANIIFWTVAVVILWRNARLSFSWSMSKNLLVFGIPLIPFFIFAWVNTASGRFMLEKYASLREVGLFALAVQFGGLIALLGGAFDKAFMPYFYETAQKPNGPEILGQFATKYFALFGLIALFTLVVARPMVLIMADPKFHEAIDYIPLLLFASWLTLMYRLFQWSLMHSKRTGMLSAMTAAYAVLMVGLLFLFLKQWQMGMKGVIYAMIIIETVRIVAGFVISMRYFKIRFKVNDLGLIALALLVSALFINFIPVEKSIILGTFIKFIIFSFVAVVIIKWAKIESIKQLISVKGR